MANQEPDVVVIGARAHPLRDAYHSLLRMSWLGVILWIAATFLFVNAIFAFGYFEVGGVTGARPGSYHDAYVFSVQTMATIGYGAMYPSGDGAHALVVGQSVAGVILTALATGIVFSRFAQSSGRIVFSKHVCISPMNGVPTVSFRIGNDAASTVFEAQVRLSVVRTEKTDEGMVFYRLLDATLTRDRSPMLSRSWTVLHPIDEKSPLFGLTPESCEANEIELMASVVGTDDTSKQPVHGRWHYRLDDFRWGARMADALSELPDGRLQLDTRKFDDIVATEPTERFPFPREAQGTPKR